VEIRIDTTAAYPAPWPSALPRVTFRSIAVHHSAAGGEDGPDDSFYASISCAGDGPAAAAATHRSLGCPEPPGTLGALVWVGGLVGR
jgi:hypothetical protein